MAILVIREVAAQSLANRSPVQKREALKGAGLLLWGSLFVIGYAGYDAMGLGFGVYQKLAWEQSPHTSFSAPALAGFRSYEKGYVDFVNDGLTLINQHRRTGDTVMSLDFSNPFSYALGMKPAPGGAITLHYGVNFTEAHHPPAERLFGEASLVIMPKKAHNPRHEHGVHAVYGPYLQTHFHPLGESREWWLYRRNSELAPNLK